MRGSLIGYAKLAATTALWTLLGALAGGSGCAGGGSKYCGPVEAACSSGATDACGTCIASCCCSEMTTCIDDSSCSSLATCMANCSSGNASCVTSCEGTYSAGLASMALYVSCTGTHCSSECGS